MNCEISIWRAKLKLDRSYNLVFEIKTLEPVSIVFSDFLS